MDKTLIRGQPTHVDTMDIAIARLRHLNIPNIYIASSSLCTFSMIPGSDNWDTAKRYFQSGRAQRKEEGFYLIPVFIGEGGEKVGHYILIVIHILNNMITGHIFDSMSSISSPQNHQEITTIDNIFKSNRFNISWKVWRCHRQSEMECGVRVIYAMTQICKGAARYLHHNAIFDAAAKISDIESNRTNLFVRQKVAKIINDTTGWWTDNTLLHLQSTNNEHLHSSRDITHKRRTRGHRVRRIWETKRRRLGQKIHFK